MFTKDERLLFAYTYMQFQQKDLLLDFWQDAYIKSFARFIAIVKSRRVGWSFICSLKGLIKAMDPDRVGYTKQFVSYNEEDALEKISYAKQFYDSMPECDAKKKLVTDNKSMLCFQDKNGITQSRLISIPCRPPRGKGGDISLDEFAIYNAKMQKLVYDAALPVISRGGTIEMGSSPLGKIGQFYDILVDKERYDYERYNIPWWFCRDLCVDVPTAVKIAPELSTEERVETFGTKILKMIFQNSDIDTFQQEFECMFIDSSESYISLDLIYENTPGKRESDIDLSLCEKMSDEEYWEYNRGIDFQAYKDLDTAILNYRPEYHGKTLFLGYDVGRHKDLSVLFLMGRTADGKKRDFARIELKNETYKKQKEMIIKAYKELPIFRGKIDRTGIGDNIYEDVHAVVGDRVEGVQFTQESKEILAIDVKRGLEQKEFLLSNDKDFHMQIHSIKRIDRGGGKHFSYDASRDDKGHADSFWAWALANSAVVSTDSKNDNFYAQRRKKKEEFMAGISPEKQEQIKKNLEEKQMLYEEMREQEFKQSVGSAAVITKGKSLRQVNMKFGFDKPDKENW
jgi:phage FluMu gp28-like protein